MDVAFTFVEQGRILIKRKALVHPAQRERLIQMTTVTPLVGVSNAPRTPMPREAPLVVVPAPQTLGQMPAHRHVIAITLHIIFQVVVVSLAQQDSIRIRRRILAVCLVRVTPFRTPAHLLVRSVQSIRFLLLVHLLVLAFKVFKCQEVFVHNASPARLKIVLEMMRVQIVQVDTFHLWERHLAHLALLDSMPPRLPVVRLAKVASIK